MNRVRAFEHDSGILMLEFRVQGQRTRMSLGHRDRERAKRQADEAATRLGKSEQVRPEQLTLGALFDNYESEVTPTKGEYSQKHDRRAVALFRKCFGSNTAVAALNVRDWGRYIRERRSGRLHPAGSKPGRRVRNRVIEQDLRFINAVFNWATLAGDGSGRMLLERNPFRGLKVPREKNPVRVTLTEGEYQALRAAAPSLDWRFGVALVLAHDTGHRIGAISQLRWSDIDFEGRTIRWRSEHDKIEYEHTTPMLESTVKALRRARSESRAIGDTPVLPSPKRPTRPMSRHFARDLWGKGQVAAGLEVKRGRGWHSLRRMFATEYDHLPLKLLCDVGGWKSAQTVLMCYQHPDEQRQRDALHDRRKPNSGRRGPTNGPNWAVGAE